MLLGIYIVGLWQYHIFCLFIFWYFFILVNNIPAKFMTKIFIYLNIWYSFGRFRGYLNFRKYVMVLPCLTYLGNFCIYTWAILYRVSQKYLNKEKCAGSMPFLYKTVFFKLKMVIPWYTVWIWESYFYSMGIIW